MKILLAHNYYQQKGGEDGVFHAEVKLLESRGHDVYQYTVHNDCIEGMRSIDVARVTIWNSKSYQDLQNLIRNRNFQIVHFHNIFPLISPAAYYAAKSEGLPVIQTLHNYRLLCPNAEFFRVGEVCERCLGKAIPLPSVQYGCYRHDRLASAAVVSMLAIHRGLNTWNRMVDRYIVLNSFAQKKFVEGGFAPEKLVVKPNFVDPDPGFGAGDGGYALFVGRLAPEKGIGTLLAAWQHLGADIPLKIAGDGPLAPQVAAAAQQTKGVDQLGKIPMEEVYELMGKAAFLVFPSEWYEGLPRTIVETFAKGTPVIASKIGAIAELVDHGRTGLLFEPGNVEDLANQVRWAIAHPNELARMRQEARAEFEAKYTADANYRQLMEIYAMVGASER
ncbi:glycosyltransferase [Leptolyngbya sp. O-77]|uniref:glycosyltransferase n=1 Tax=Leptolyngbya sp. O-77 TaxID=1080068 RepID=UPI00074D3072|nr:glycosyltransferase [Leptolyngbya sp. O-77]BAU44005.1 Alpha-D-kanosaminyltransferase [Leptolyngbya sp. O-77]